MFEVKTLGGRFWFEEKQTHHMEMILLKKLKDNSFLSKQIPLFRLFETFSSSNLKECNNFRISDYRRKKLPLPLFILKVRYSKNRHNDAGWALLNK